MDEPMAMDYDSAADAYARNRVAGGSVVDELGAYGGITSEHRVLEVGCGTASYILSLVNATGCRGWGVEPSGGMRDRAGLHERLELLEAAAESLPFDAGSFDLVFSVNVIHHVTDVDAHYREAKRVLRSGGMICTATDSAEMIRSRRPLSVYWPGSAEADIARYPTVENLVESMRQAGFAGFSLREVRTPFSVTDIAPYREKVFSCLHLISEKEFEIGLRRLEADLQRGPVEGFSECVCVWGVA